MKLYHIPGYEGLYSATKCGKIFSHRRNKFLSPSIRTDGYYIVGLTKDNIRSSPSVHRII